MKKLGTALLLIGLTLFCWRGAYGATAPEVTIVGRTTTTVSVTTTDTYGTLAAQDSIVFIFAVTAADSLDGTGLSEVRTANADTSGTIVLSGLPERTWGFIIVRVDSVGVKAYSQRDTVRTLTPQIIDARRPDFTVPVGMNLTDASSFPGASSTATTWTIKTTGVDSTGMYYSAPYSSLLLSVVGQTDSTNVKIVQMSGYTDEANLSGATTTANWYAINTFMFAPADTINVTTAGTYYLLEKLDGVSPGNAINEMHYFRLLGQATNDKSTGTVLNIREIRGN